MTTASMTFSAQAYVPGANPLPVFYPPPWLEVAGVDDPLPASKIVTTSVNGNSPGTVRFQEFVNVLGTGRRGYLMRVIKNDSQYIGGLRCSFSFWGNATLGNLVTATDYWFAYANRAVGGEFPLAASGTSSDQHQMGLSLHAKADVPSCFLNVRYGGSGNWSILTNHSGTTTVGDQPLSGVQPLDTWVKNIVHVRLGSTTASNPRIEWWIIKSGVTTKIVDLSGSAATGQYHDSAGGFYVKQGLYFWGMGANPSSWTVSPYTRALYFSDMHFGQGNTADMYSRAEASLAGF